MDRKLHKVTEDVAVAWTDPRGRAWKVDVFRGGEKVAGNVPVAWSVAWEKGKPPHQAVWFPGEIEALEAVAAPERRLIALAQPKDPDAERLSVARFSGVYWMTAVGPQDGNKVRFRVDERFS